MCGEELTGGICAIDLATFVLARELLGETDVFYRPHTSTLRFSDVIRHGGALHMDYSRRHGWGS